MEPEESVKDVVRKESARQAVEFAFGLAFIGVMYLVQNRDEYRHLKMATALATKRFAQKQADWWQNVADKAATIYNGEKA